MNRIHFALFLLLIATVHLNCQKDFSHANSGTTNIENNLPAPITATLQGNILDEAGQPAGGVQIKVGSKTTTTNATGYFRITNAELDKNASMVTAEKPGYFKAFRTFNATSAVNQVVIKLLKKTLAGSVDANSGGELALPNGAKIALPANGVVQEQNGSAYTGTVNVYAAYIDPTAADIRETVPGSFMANDRNDKRVSLVSFGMMAVVLESSSGEKLQIKSGQTAKLTTPIPSALQSSAPASISLWYVDEQTGLWKEEGTAAKNGTNYQGDVKHFTYWNADFSEPAITLSMTLINAQSQPVVYANVQISGTQGAAHGYTDSAGTVTGLVPANQNLILQVFDECGTAVYSQNIGPFDANTSLGNITITNTTSSIVTVQGKLLSCSNVPVTNGYAIVYLNNVPRYAATNDDGDFSTTFVMCAGSVASCEILGVDDASSQQGTITNTTIVSPVTNAGNISACGTSSNEFVNYNLDGTDYNLSKPGTDSLIAYSISGTGQSFTTFIMAYKLNDGINFNFINNGAAGTFALSGLYVMNLNSIGLIKPFDVTLTSYPQAAGEFYEGSFSGQFRDSTDLTPLHTISCSFRVRKY